MGMKALALVLAAVALGLSRGSTSTTRGADTLSLDEARAYMVELINADRSAKNLVPVALDPVATAAAQRHADDMAARRYMSHYSLEGKSPNQRYTEAGGTGYARENVYLLSTRYTDVSTAPGGTPADLVPRPVFTRREIEEIESSYVNEVPPADGHRKNVFAPEHTHVGIGLARSASANGRALANAQEFVDRYLEVEPLALNAAPGQEVRVAGRILGDARLRSVTVGRGPLPTPISREEAAAIHSYSIPAADETYWPAPYRSPRPVTLSSTGEFSVTLPLGKGRAPGLFYIGVWINDHGRDLLASLRTVVVR